MSEVLTWEKNPDAGLRFSFADGMAVGACLLATAWAWGWIGAFALVAPFVLGHFFLFCNIFRIRRSLELIWAGSFLLQAFLWLFLGPIPDFSSIALTQLPITAGVIAYEVKSSRYHGIFSDRINPMLDRYLEQRRSKR